jgi:serine phosphatase RsbU (regulator of sigma subunit)
VLEEEEYPSSAPRLIPGDQVIFSTDGVTEALHPQGRMFGLDELDRALANCGVGAADILREALEAVDRFTEGKAADDDRTVFGAKVR